MVYILDYQNMIDSTWSVCIEKSLNFWAMMLTVSKYFGKNCNREIIHNHVHAMTPCFMVLCRMPIKSHLNVIYLLLVNKLFVQWQSLPTAILYVVCDTIVELQWPCTRNDVLVYSNEGLDCVRNWIVWFCPIRFPHCYIYKSQWSYASGPHDTAS